MVVMYVYGEARSLWSDDWRCIMIVERESRVRSTVSWRRVVWVCVLLVSPARAVLCALGLRVSFCVEQCPQLTSRYATARIQHGSGGQLKSELLLQALGGLRRVAVDVPKAR